MSDFHTPPTYRLRQARAEEDVLLPAIEERAGRLFGTSAHPEVVGHASMTPQMVAAHRLQGLCFVMADEHDRPVGFAACGQLDDALHLYELNVEPAHGKKGLGRALVEAVCAQARIRGLRAVTLSTFTDVPWNAPFYRHAGFRILPPQSWTPALHFVAGHERAMGLTSRCIMARDV